MNTLPTTISVGIMSAPSIRVILHGQWQEAHGQFVAEGEHQITAPTHLEPRSPHSTFTLCGVTIGKQYHWERQEDQTFSGSLRIIEEGALLTAVNIIAIEDYLLSVISSEMSATAGLEFLKASAVISRSWVIKMILRARNKVAPQTVGNHHGINTPDTYITWFDHEDHTLYDVCADDHCQRYQGITRATNPNVSRAIEATRGEVLTYDGEVCDCRFSKCCGGRMEKFPTCWEERDVPYLQALEDCDPHNGTILCNTHDKRILAQVLNNYDQETTDFYRWTVEYTQSQLSDLISRKLNRNFGQIIELRPLRRGPSGRIYQLLIRGTQQQLTIGKELIIRSALSETHLYSSAFDIEAIGSGSLPDRFILRGKGWGHGVGMCQIGAAVMAERGYAYTEILSHYYPETKIITAQPINHEGKH